MPEQQQAEQPQPQKVGMSLLPGVPTVEELSDLFFLLTGKRPSEEEMEDARSRLQQLKPSRGTPTGA